LFDKFYKPLTDKIGVEPDFSKLANLIPISFTKDPKIRLQKINKYVDDNKIESSYCYSIIASCYKDLKQTKVAIKFHKKSIDLDEYNYSAWNNLGQIYELFDLNYFEAKKCYEKAISAKADLDLPRLNLGVLLKNHFNDIVGAKEQFEEILKFDENNAKAHNNLGNIYRRIEFLDLDKALKHLIIAVNQNNIEATINYANYIKVVKKDFDLGNSFYQKAKDLDTDNIYTEIIDLMMKSDKG
jgi:tetratricopeptide (TPR) repeat protein